MVAKKAVKKSNDVEVQFASLYALPTVCSGAIIPTPTNDDFVKSSIKHAKAWYKKSLICFIYKTQEEDRGKYLVDNGFVKVFEQAGTHGENIILYACDLNKN